MKLKGLLIAGVIMVSMCGQAQAQNGELSGVFDVTYTSQFVWRGFDVYADDHSAVQPGIDLNLWDTGFGLSLWYSRANQGSFENAQWLDFSLYYKNSLFEAESYQTNYTTGYVYYSFPEEPRKGGVVGTAALQEFFVNLSWPVLLPAGLVPSYTVALAWPSVGGSAGRNNGGWVHVLGVGYDVTVPGLTAEMPEQVLHFSLDTVYNDGIGPAPGGTEHDWSHAVVGVSTGFDLGNNLTFTPAVYYQSSWEDSVNTEDECWTSLTLSYKF